MHTPTVIIPIDRFLFKRCSFRLLLPLLGHTFRSRIEADLSACSIEVYGYSDYVCGFHRYTSINRRNQITKSMCGKHTGKCLHKVAVVVLNCSIEISCFFIYRHSAHVCHISNSKWFSISCRSILLINL